MDEQEFGMTKEEMQRILIRESQHGSSELEAYRALIEIIGIEWPGEPEPTENED